MKNTCEHCGTTFTRIRRPGRSHRFCSLACYHEHPRIRREGITHRLVRLKGHPIAPSGGVLAQARVVLYDSIGPGPHSCHWCGTPLNWKPGEGVVEGALIVDHLNHDAADDRVENLVATCFKCNAHRTRNGDRALIRDDELFITNSNGSRTRATRRLCEMCAKPFVVRISQVKTGKGRFCSMSCARSKSIHVKHQE